MRHGDADGAPMPLNTRWVSERNKTKNVPAAAVGRMGTIAECVAGDVVACESMDRKRVIYLEIAWLWPDGKAAMVRLYDFKARAISLRSEFMRIVRSTQRVRWLGVRAK